jgi:regulator of replication initiation timing
MKQCRLINRQVVRTIVPDIYALGYSIVNESVSGDIERCLTKDSVMVTDDQPVGEVDDLASMIAAYNDLRHRLSRLESELKARTEENNIMRQELDELKSTAGSNAAPAQSTDTPTVLETLDFPPESKASKGKKKRKR